MLFVSGQPIPHCWFGTGGPIGSRGSSSLNHRVPWFSDTGRANAGCGDVGSAAGGVVPTGVAVVLDGAGGEFDGAGGEFDRAIGEFNGAAGAAGTGRLIVVLPVSLKLAAAASIASAALISEFGNFGPESPNLQPPEADPILRTGC